jgi:hypothetical protein
MILRITSDDFPHILDTHPKAIWVLHPENGCLLRILEGSLMENIKQDESTKMNFYGTNYVSYMHNLKGSHKITALSQTFSLHLYSPPGYYDLKKNV